jgi:hypothetical protein
MSHKILGDRFLSRSQPAWHELGIVFPEDETILPVEAVKRVAGDLTIKKVPLFMDLDPQAAIREGDTVDQNLRRVEDHFGIVRMPTDDAPEPGFLGTVSGKWHATSYVELAEKLNKIDQSTYKVETAGVLEDGRRCFISLRGEDWAVLNTDEMRTYFLVQLSLEPGVGHRVRHTPIRVVCWNTETLAEAQSKITLNIPHAADAAQQIGLCADLLVRFKKAQADTKRIFDALAAKEALPDQTREILSAAWPMPPVPSKLKLFKNVLKTDEAAETFKKNLDMQVLESLEEAQRRFDTQVTRVEKLREAGWDRFEAFKPNRLKHTLWAAYNAVTEVADWREGKGAEVGSLFGDRANEKARAFSKAVALLEN